MSCDYGLQCNCDTCIAIDLVAIEIFEHLRKGKLTMRCALISLGQTTRMITEKMIDDEGATLEECGKFFSNGDDRAKEAVAWHRKEKSHEKNDPSSTHD